jgi:transcriptional regulator with XRE-family HTH domain
MENNHGYEKIVREKSQKIAELIEKMYDTQGYNQTTWAEKLGWTQGKISHFKNGRNKVSMEYILKAAAALGISASDIIEAVRSDTDYEKDDIEMLFKLHDVIRNKKKDPGTHSTFKKILL